MSGRKISIQCQFDEGVVARMEALGLAVPEGEAPEPAWARRRRLVELLLMSGLEAEEARRDAAKPPPGEAPTPRTDLPTWLREKGKP